MEEDRGKETLGVAWEGHPGGVAWKLGGDGDGGDGWALMDGLLHHSVFMHIQSY